MAVTIEEVKVWCRYGGIAHAVQSEKGGYLMTACGTFGNMRRLADGIKPTRICGKCREALKKAVLTSNGAVDEALKRHQDLIERATDAQASFAQATPVRDAAEDT